MIKRPLSDSPLTAEERVFAEAHHNLMYRYMRIHDLDIEEWYDRLIIAYLNSVKKYLRYEKLQSLKFEQVFSGHLTMQGATIGETSTDIKDVQKAVYGA